MPYIAEISYRGDHHESIWVPDNKPENLAGVKQTIDLHYVGETDHVRVSLIDQETQEEQDITGDILCGPK
tara:strand:+ start:219 stop:428 length:210 start_codon:yes stop_codon:yes gene_type:complete